MQRVHDLVPFAHVAEPARSIAFYRRLGFEVVDSVDGDPPAWAFLQNERACLMVARSPGPIDAERQGVLFYLYARDLGGLRDQLLGDGVPVGEITYPEHMPEGELALVDPDGYELLIGQLADPTQRR